MKMNRKIKGALDAGVAIPACPLALNRRRKLDERRQRALFRYYNAAGAGGLAVGVHTTQFAIREPRHGLFEPVLQIAAEEMDRADEKRPEKLIRVGGICGQTKQAVAEAELLNRLGYHTGLLNLGAMRGKTDKEIIAHCEAVAKTIPVFGFFLHPAVGGLELPFSFWRRFAEIENVVAIKIAAFNRYQTIDVIRAVAESGRKDIALYTGNDDNIIVDLITPHKFKVNGRKVTRRFAGGLLGHWAVWTKKAVDWLSAAKAALKAPGPTAEQLGFPPGADPELFEFASRCIGFATDDILPQAIAVTDCNSVFFDAANNFKGCIPGLHEVLRRQGLLEGLWCLDPDEILSPGQKKEIDRVYRAYPHLNDDAFVAKHRDKWLNG